MKLSTPPLRRLRKRSAVSAAVRPLTTEPGFANANRQTVMAATGAPSATRDGQSIYRMRCGACAYEYGCSGIDVKARLCPRCQGGAPGEALRAPQPTLFGD